MTQFVKVYDTADQTCKKRELPRVTAGDGVAVDVSVSPTGATTYEVNVTAATDTAPGAVALAVASEFPSLATNNTQAATPAYVAAAANAVFEALSPCTAVEATPAQILEIDLTDRVVICSDGTLANFQLGDLPFANQSPATDTSLGLVTLAVEANFPSTSNTEATTPAYVDTAIDTAIAAIPPVPAATDTVSGRVSLAVAANHPSTSNTEATTPAYVNAAIAAIPPTPAATDTVSGLVSLAVAANYPSVSNTEAATPAYVTNAINEVYETLSPCLATEATPAQVAEIDLTDRVVICSDGVLANFQLDDLPFATNGELNAISPCTADAATPAQIAGIDLTDRVVICSDGALGSFTLGDLPFATLAPASDTSPGIVSLAVSANHPSTSNTEATTPAYVTTAINAAIAGLPADVFLSSLGSYNATTNIMTLNMSDGSTVPVDMTGLVNDAVASVPAATDTVAGKVSLAVAANHPSTSNTEAATPAYVSAAVAAAVGGIPSTPAATDTAQGIVSLAVAANYPSTSDTEAATPAYVSAALTPWVAQASIAAVSTTTDGVGNIVDYATGAAIPLADFGNAQAPNTAISLDMAEAVFTNRAVEPTALGVMNVNGTLGYQSVTATTATFTQNNGSTISVSGAAGVVAIPDGAYTGQMVNITCGGSDAILEGKFRGVLRNTDGAFQDYNGPAVSQISLRLLEGITFRWNTDRWGAISHSMQQKYASTHPLVDVATLDNSDRGLVLGFVDVPVSRALTVAEVGQTNASRVAVPLNDMGVLLTNRAAEPVTGAGMRNDNGTLGHFMTNIGVASGTDVAVSTQFADEVTKWNGVMLRFPLTNGQIIDVPAPRYAGQVVNLCFSIDGGNDYSEAVLRFPHGIGGSSGARTSGHSFGDNFAATDVIVRSNEIVRLVAQTTTNWIIHHEIRNIATVNVTEHANGRVTIAFADTFGNGVAVLPGDNLTVDIVLPVAITNPNDVTVFITDRATLPGAALGSNTVPATQQPGTYSNSVSLNTPTTLRVTVFNNTPVTLQPGGCNFLVHNARIDYAAIGGIASY